MIFSVSWLPELVIYDRTTPFDEYYNAIYEFFKEDFVNTKPCFRSKKVGLQKEPRVNGKVQTFHHMTTEEHKDKQGKITRVPSEERCERIKWNKVIIESNYFALKIFPEKRNHNRNNIVIWFEEIDYVIILRDAKTYFVFITAYPIKYEHKRRQLRKSFEAYKKAETAR